MGGAAAAQAQSLEQASSQFAAQIPQGSSQIEIPADAYGVVSDTAKRFNIAVPDFIKPQAPAVAGTVADATRAHLKKQGHHYDAKAEEIAKHWAGQAAEGKVTFYDNAGDGITHLDMGSGNVYRLTPKTAQERVDWLNRDVPVNQGPGKGFGVATSFDGKYIYLVEYFLN